MNTAKKANLFKNDTARTELQNWYGRFLEKSHTPVIRKHVSTSCGQNHVLFAGDESKPPLVILHAMMSSSAHALSVLWRLAKDFYIIAPDIPGQSIIGPEVCLPFDEYGSWLNEIMEELKVNPFYIMGISWGGFVSLKYTLEYPDKVTKMALLVPAGIVRGKVAIGLLKMAIPAITYKMKPTEERLKRLIEPIMTTFDDDWSNFMGDMFLKFNPDMRIPPLLSDAELGSIRTPALVIGADMDISFPGNALVERVKKEMPFVETELLKNSRHCPPLDEEFTNWLAQRSSNFFLAGYHEN
jgi:2-hydroxy-6-oxonona-2,4-dienedioate hydrolase